MPQANPCNDYAETEEVDWVSSISKPLDGGAT